MKHRMARMNTKKEESSMTKAPQPMIPACFRIVGIAMLPTTDAPVKNLAASNQLLDKWGEMDY